MLSMRKVVTVLATLVTVIGATQVDAQELYGVTCYADPPAALVYYSGPCDGTGGQAACQEAAGMCGGSAGVYCTGGPISGGCIASCGIDVSSCNN